MIRSKKSAQNNMTSAADIAKDTRSEFEKAGFDVPPVNIRNAAQASKEIEYLSEKIAQGVEWDEQVKAIKRGMGLVNGGALEFDEFSDRLSNLGPGLVAGCCNLRSALVKQSCLFIAQLVHNLRKKFAVFGEVIAPLSKQTTHGTLIIAESCKLAIFEIVKYCPKKNVFFSIVDLSKSKAGENRQISADSFILMLNFWGKHILDQYNEIVMRTLRLLLVDSQPLVRNSARIASKLFASKFSKYSELFLATLDSKTKSAVLSAEVPPGTPPIKETQDDVPEVHCSPVIPIETKVSEHLLFSPHSPKSYIEEVKRQSEKRRLAEQNGLTKPDELNPNQRQSKLPFKKKPKKQVEKPSMIPIFSKTADIARSKSPSQIPSKKKSKMSNKHRSSSVRVSNYGNEMNFSPHQKQNNDDNIRYKSTERSIDKNPKLSDEEIKINEQKTTKRKSEPMEKNLPPPRLGKKRASSPANNEFTPLRKSAILLEEGNEKELVDQISKYLDQNRTKELFSQMRYIVPGLVITLNCKSRALSNKSMSLISTLMDIFPNEFKSSLQSMFEILFGGLLSDIVASDNEELLESLLSTIRKNYNSNDLIAIVLTQVPSARLTKFAASLTENPKTDLSNLVVAKKLAKLGIMHMKSCPDEAQTILVSIARQNRNVLTDLSHEYDLLTSEYLNSILNYSDAKSQESPDIDSESNIELLCSNVRQYLRNVSAAEYVKTSKKFYASLVNAVHHHNDVIEDADKLFGVMCDCLDQKGCDNFEILLECAICQIDMDKSTPNSQKLIRLLEARADSEKLVGFFLNEINSTNKMASQYVDELYSVIKANPDKIKPFVRQISKVLCDNVNHINTFVRKSVVFCIALLIHTYGEIAEQVTRDLDISKQRLISLYVSKLNQ